MEKKQTQIIFWQKNYFVVTLAFSGKLLKKLIL